MILKLITFVQNHKVIEHFYYYNDIYLNDILHFVSSRNSSLRKQIISLILRIIPFKISVYFLSNYLFLSVESNTKYLFESFSAIYRFTRVIPKYKGLKLLIFIQLSIFFFVTYPILKIAMSLYDFL